MVNTELVVAISSGTVFLIIIILAVMYFMKVGFMLKAVAWVRKLLGTSLRDQAGERCGTSNVASYDDNADELWDIISTKTDCPVPSSSSTTTTTTSNTPTTSDLYQQLASNCSAYNVDMMKGVPTVWTPTRINTYLQFPANQCPDINSYTFAPAENNWLDINLASKCPNVVTAGYTALQKYKTYTNNCTPPTGVPTTTGPAGRTFYKSDGTSTLKFSGSTGDQVTFNISSPTGSYAYNDSTGDITFTWASTITGAPATANYKNSVFTVTGSSWSTSNPVNKLNGVTYYDPSTPGRSINIVSPSELKYTSGPNVTPASYAIGMQLSPSQGQIYFLNPDPTVGITTIAFSTVGTTSPDTVQVDTVTWTKQNISSLQSLLNSLTNRTFYAPNSSSWLQLSTTPNQATYSPSTQVTYTATQSGTTWTFTFSQDFMTYGKIATLSVGPPNTFQMGTTVFSATPNSTPSSEPRYPQPTITGFNLNGFDSVTGSIPNEFSSTRLSYSPLGPYFRVSSAVNTDRYLDLINAGQNLGVWQSDTESQNQYFKLDTCGRFVPKVRPTETFNAVDAIVVSSLNNQTTWSYNRNTKQFKNSSNQCLQAPASVNTNGALVSVQPCSDTNTSQKWNIVEPKINIRLTDNDQYWIDNWDLNYTDVKMAGPTNDTVVNRVLIYDRFTGQLQFEDKDNFSNPRPGKCVTTQYDASSNKILVKQDTCDIGNTRMKWFFDQTSKNIINMYNFGCLTGGQSTGTPVTVQACGQPNQQWKITNNGSDPNPITTSCGDTLLTILNGKYYLHRSYSDSTSPYYRLGFFFNSKGTVQVQYYNSVNQTTPQSGNFTVTPTGINTFTVTFNNPPRTLFGITGPAGIRTFNLTADTVSLTMQEDITMVFNRSDSGFI